MYQHCTENNETCTKRSRDENESFGNQDRIGAHLLATHAALTSLPVEMNVTKEPVDDVERLLLATDKFMHLLSEPLDLSAHHKFEHACSHINEKISRHCENVKRRCSSYETFLDGVLTRQKIANEQTKRSSHV